MPASLHFSPSLDETVSNNMNGGYPDQRPKMPGQNHGQNRRYRIPSADEALQFSPFTSILPFDVETVPIPHASFPASLSRIPMSDTESRLASSQLSILDREASDPRTTSQRLEQTLNDLRYLLRTSELEQFHIKGPTPSDGLSPNVHGPQADSHVQKPSQLGSQLSAFSSRAFDTTSFRFAVVNEAKTIADLNRTNHAQNSNPTSSTKVAPTVSKPRETSSTVAVSTPESHRFAHPPVGTPKPMISIPVFPAAERSKYQDYPEVDDSIIAHHQTQMSNKRKREDEAGVFQDKQQGPRDHSTTYVTALEDLMEGIFNAEDQLHSHHTEISSPVLQEYFDYCNHGDGSEIVLTASTLLSLEQSITKVVSSGRFSDSSIESICRVQKLCLSVLASADEIDLALPEHSDMAQDQWSTKLESVSNGLQASKVICRIVAAHREEKDLISEEILLAAAKSLRKVLENLLIPLVELRSHSEVFQLLQNTEERSAIIKLLSRSSKVLKLLGEVVIHTEAPESFVTGLEFLTTRLIFAENAGNEKDSLLGIAKFEAVRRIAMDTLSKIFLRCPDQRFGIFTEILSSLERLPVTRQSARHYRTSDGQSIQLVSALIMQLVQTSATKISQSRGLGTEQYKEYLGEENADNDDKSQDADGYDSAQDSSPTKRKSKRERSSLAIDDLRYLGDTAKAESLRGLSTTLSQASINNTSMVSRYLVDRALTSTKSGEQPYRNLLDIFIEDFINVFGSMEWPGAELLLRALLLKFVEITESDKFTAPAKTMALELMGLMGSGIADQQIHLRQACQNLESTETSWSKQLLQLTQNGFENASQDENVLSLTGPFRMVVDYLNSRTDKSLQLQSARNYILTTWAQRCCHSFVKDPQKQENGTQNHVSKPALTSWLLEAILEPEAVNSTITFQTLTTAEARLAYTITLLNTPFCLGLGRILSILTTSLSSHQTTVRNRSLKSVTQLLEKSPQLMERPSVLNAIIQCTSDQSAMVRDSALSLIGQCLVLRPSFVTHALRTIIQMVSDPAVSVRKRCIKLLKDLYLRHASKEQKVTIATTLVSATSAVEETVLELAHQTIEDIWITPFQSIDTKSDLSPSFKQALQEEGFLLVAIAIAQKNLGKLDQLEAVFERLLVKSSKNYSTNKAVSKALVILMFDSVFENDVSQGEHYSQKGVLQVLPLFAKACPTLFNAQQMVHLKPYIENLASGDDLPMFRAVVIIYRCVFPTLSSLEHTFLRSVHASLSKALTKVHRAEIREVARCLWIIDAVLQDATRVVKTMLGILTAISMTTIDSLKNATAAKNCNTLILLAGYIGREYSFEPHLADFKLKFAKRKFDSVSALMVNLLCPFTSPQYPQAFRSVALESIGLLCQAWPKNFLNNDVNEALESVFQTRNSELEDVVLKALKAFYDNTEDRSKSGADIQIGEGATNGAQRLGTSMTLTDFDGAINAIAGHYRADVLRIALGGHDAKALTAVQIIGSINRQGLVHPTECCSAFVALETSANPVIAKLAFNDHKAMHHKYESMLEKENLKAVEQAYIYQKTVFDNISGVCADLSPKLHYFYDVLKEGSTALRKKFLANLCAKLNFALVKFDLENDKLSELHYACFVLQNLALFEYARIDELLHLVRTIEDIFKRTGNSLSQHLENKLKISLDEKPVGTEDESKFTSIVPTDVAPPPLISASSLRPLTIASMILSIFWETRLYLRRAWSLHMYTAGKKQATRDVNKAPMKSSAAAPEKFIARVAEIMTSLKDESTMLLQCKSFLDQLSIDSEHKVLDSDEENDDIKRAYTPLNDDAENQSMPPSGGSQKRWVGDGTGQTPKKQRNRPSLGRRKSSKAVSYNDDDDDDDDTAELNGKDY